MTSREKFEAWFLSEHEEVENSNELSAKVMKMMAWQSWQAASKELEQKLEESQREFRSADATIHNLELKLTDMAVQLANAESKCRELAAENSGQKSGVTYFAFAPEYGFDYFANKQDAIDTA
ncbi:hypothetical protein NLN86_25115, partial [Citrobacter portucalensis]|nr:hypothetical protein [Citrobacter portucalensis]